MNPSIAPAIPGPAAPSRRGRWRIALLIVAGMLAVLGLVIGYGILSTRNAWKAAEDETDRLDPRWRLAELAADLPAIPDAENSALLIIAVHRKGKGVNVSGAPRYDAIFDKLPANVQLNEQQTLFIRSQLAKIAEPLREARKLKDMPRGRFKMVYTDDFYMSLLTDQQNSRVLADWLPHDAWLLAQDGDCDAAADSCQACLNVSRAMSGEFTLIALLIRIAIQNIALNSLERVLAQGEVSAERLQGFQALLEKDIADNGFLAAVRGERAGAHHLFENLRTNKVKIGPLVRAMYGGRPSWLDEATTGMIEIFPTIVLSYYPDHLRFMNRCIESAKLPTHERTAKLHEWEDACKETRNPVSRALAPALTKVHQADCRSQAMLRSALVALACERYRLKHNTWPAAIEHLVQEKLLTAIPKDPMDGQPIRYLRTKEGIVVYSVGIDKVDNQGNIDRDRPHQPGVDIGFRLWNEHRRRQPPLPPVALPDAANDGRQ